MRLRNRHQGEPLLPFADVLAAVGAQGVMGTEAREVPLDAVVGSVARPEEFDAHFRPRRRTDRWARTRARFDAGQFPPPVELIQLGDLYFVEDGHHRVAVARERGWASLPARVRRICTVAVAQCCLRMADLADKRAERDRLHGHRSCSPSRPGQRLGAGDCCTASA